MRPGDITNEPYNIRSGFTAQGNSG